MRGTAAAENGEGRLGWATEADVRALAGICGGLCASLYLPLRSSARHRLENARRIGGAIARMSERLRDEAAPLSAALPAAAHLEALDGALGRLGRLPPGLAVFLHDDEICTFKLATPPSESVVVADYFSLRQLLRQIDVLEDAEPKPGPREPARLALELDRILAAAVRERIRVLWARDGAVIPGRLDLESGRVVSAGGRDGDVMDALTACVLRAGAEVRIVRAEHMPGPVNAAAELY